MVEIEVDLQDEIADALKYIEPKLVDRALRSTLNRAAKPIEQKVKQLAPEDTGTLSGSISKKYKARDGYAVVYVGLANKTPGWLATRALAMEYGNTRVDPQEYLAPAMEQVGPDALEDLRDYFNKRLHALAKKAQ
ncbi:HK97 gp10 family phage protein [Endozoicomonas acroporae]|uniref:HK97 gp10 family phage protein n=1 Tax=Endozoicomonas acroporae TaxID=1701104 RepID=UPI003D7A55A6